MRAGWMRPSCEQLLERHAGRSRAARRRSADSTTALGVSSMMKSTPVRFSSARMLRPSRPMMRPFMSSLGELDDRDGRLGGVAGGQALHGDREDRAHAALGVALGLLLDRRARSATESWRAWSSTSLSSDLLGLARAQPGDALELAPCSSRSRRAPPPARRARSTCASRLALARVELGRAAVERLARASSARSGRAQRRRAARLAATSSAARRGVARARRWPRRAARAVERRRPRRGRLPERPPRSRFPLPCPLPASRDGAQPRRSLRGSWSGRPAVRGGGIGRMWRAAARAALQVR